MRTALILGVSGQDGAYLSRFLLGKNYTVHGTSRDDRQKFARLGALGIRNRVQTHALSTVDRDAMQRLIARLLPDEIYNLSGLSSVALSFEQPASAWSSIADAHELVLDIARTAAPKARVYQSSSSECFGNVPEDSAANEETAFAPLSPYAEAKVAAHHATSVYRNSHGLYACSGIVFNHESPLRSETFVTQKIVAAAAAIAAGASAEKLRLGDISAARDWGYAPEYVEAMWLMLQQREPCDFVIASGESHTVAELASATFAEFGLDVHEHVIVDDSLLRRAEIRHSRGDARRAYDAIGWTARTKFSTLVRLLADAAASTDRFRPVMTTPLGT